MFFKSLRRTSRNDAGLSTPSDIAGDIMECIHIAQSNGLSGKWMCFKVVIGPTLAGTEGNDYHDLTVLRYPGFHKKLSKFIQGD